MSGVQELTHLLDSIDVALLERRRASSWSISGRIRWKREELVLDAVLDVDQVAKLMRNPRSNTQVSKPSQIRWRSLDSTGDPHLRRLARDPPRSLRRWLDSPRHPPGCAEQVARNGLFNTQIHESQFVANDRYVRDTRSRVTHNSPGRNTTEPLVTLPCRWYGGKIRAWQMRRVSC